MESLTSAEAFPALYRAILDGVAELEHAGQRAEAHQIRREATAAYSGAWGEGGQRRLAGLVARIERGLASLPLVADPTAPASIGRDTPAGRGARPASPLRNAAGSR